MGNQSKQDELPKHDIRPEVSQFIRNEMHVINKDIRESLRSDVKESKTQIINQNWKIFVLLISIFGAGNIVAVSKVEPGMGDLADVWIAIDWQGCDPLPGYGWQAAGIWDCDGCGAVADPPVGGGQDQE